MSKMRLAGWKPMFHFHRSPRIQPITGVRFFRRNVGWVAVSLLSFFSAAIPATVKAQRSGQPNIIFILTDDMGYGDLSCFNGRYFTPNLDHFAAEGRKFLSYYSASPICSPSRAGFLTGMAPAKWNITSYLQKRVDNRRCEQADFLDADAPSIARVLQANGYATGHFGKWHMGGGRDVDNAPAFTRYGFDEYNSTWESPDPDPLITATDWIWSDQDSIKRWDRTAYFVDRTLAFLQQHKDQPCYVNLWPDDVHTPWVAGDEFVGRYPGGPEQERSFIRVLEEYDRQMGRLFQGLKALGIDDNTLVVFTSDNGPLPNFRDDRSAGYRGSKLSLYEGGIRMPFMVRWPGHIPAGTTDTVSVLSATDLFPSFASIAGAPLPAGYVSDGEDKSKLLTGEMASHVKPLYWEYGRNDSSFRYPTGRDRSPTMAMREGEWKLLMNVNGTAVELYNVEDDPHETTNLAAFETARVTRMQMKLEKWWQALPKLNAAVDKKK